MKVLVLGAAGMLGRYVLRYFESEGIEVMEVTREDFQVDLTTNLGAVEHMLKHLAGDNDVVINCIGLIKPQVDKYGVALSVMVNSLFPHLLAEACKKRGLKMIHITTDCVFSGAKGGYVESDPHDVYDTYGRTKSLGEPANCMVVRTSIIGEEVGQGRSLVEWVKSNKGKEINGFLNHQWNGVTCLELAKFLKTAVKGNNYREGVSHFYSAPVNKCELLEMINRAYSLNIWVVPVNAAEGCDRTLSSLNPFVYSVPPLEDQIKEMEGLEL